MINNNNNNNKKNNHFRVGCECPLKAGLQGLCQSISLRGMIKLWLLRDCKCIGSVLSAPTELTVVSGFVHFAIGQVSLRASHGVMAVERVPQGQEVRGQNQSMLSIAATSVHNLNELLAQVSYSSVVYLLETGDLGRSGCEWAKTWMYLLRCPCATLKCSILWFTKCFWNRDGTTNYKHMDYEPPHCV